jgi:hypothetical protein
MAHPLYIHYISGQLHAPSALPSGKDVAAVVATQLAHLSSGEESISGLGHTSILDRF